MESLHVSRLKNRICEVEIVSFDIFDTLLLRNVIHPTDIFKAVEVEYNLNAQSHIEFYSLRVKAEDDARRLSIEEDITFDEIYQCLEKELGPIAEELKYLEIDVEEKFLTANVEMKEVYDWARSMNKKIFIISDMYLPVDVIKELLEINGFEQYDRIYVSSELMKTKASGSIYPYIRETEHIASDVKWLHIGDNYHSDVITAEANRVEGYHYPKLQEREKIEAIESLGDSIVRAIQLKHKYSYTSQDYWYRFGADHVSSVYIGLMNWMKEQLRGKDNIYFLARDGYIPYKLYDILTQYDTQLPKGKYLYASRRAFIYPQLLYVNRAEALEVLTAYNGGLNQKITLQEIMDNIGLDSEYYTSTISNYNFSSFNETINESNLKDAKNFLASIWSDIEVVLQRELSLLEKYLEESGVGNVEVVNIFDIGWRGSTQLALQKILRKPVRGYYFGTADNIYEEIKKNTYGFAFHIGHPKSNRQLIMDYVMMFEFIFTAPEGSLINFTSDSSNRIVPNLSKVERNEKMYDYIERFQLGAIDIFKLVLNYQSYISDISTTFSLNGMKQVVTSYKASDMLHFLELTNSVGFGHSNDTKEYVYEVELKDYLSNIKNYNTKSSYLLWKYALLIKDEQGRGFNQYEISKLYNLRTSRIKADKINRFFILLKKAIRNPRKAKDRLFIIAKAKFSRHM